MNRKALDRYMDSPYKVFGVGPEQEGAILFVADNYIKGMIEHNPDNQYPEEKLTVVYNRLLALLSNNQACLLVVSKDDILIGSIILLRYMGDLSDIGDKLFVTGLYILPEYRVPGPACALIAQGREVCRGSNISQIVYCISENEPDRLAYKLWNGKETSKTFIADVE